MAGPESKTFNTEAKQCIVMTVYTVGASDLHIKHLEPNPMALAECECLQYNPLTCTAAIRHLQLISNFISDSLFCL